MALKKIPDNLPIVKNLQDLLKSNNSSMEQLLKAIEHIKNYAESPSNKFTEKEMYKAFAKIIKDSAPSAKKTDEYKIFFNNLKDLRELFYKSFQNNNKDR